MAGHLGGTHSASPEGTDSIDGASRTGQPESPPMADGDRPRRRRPHRESSGVRVWESRGAGGRGAGHRGLAGLGAHAPDGAEKAVRCRVLTGKTRAVWGHSLKDEMMCAAAVSGPTSARMVRG